jgi:inorganic triphosphatase YgiF
VFSHNVQNFESSVLRQELANMKRTDNKSGGPREIELRFVLPPGGRAALENNDILAAAKVKKHHLITTYFDTPDGILDAAGLTLRVRRSGNTRMQTVKTRPNLQSVASDRNEWEWRINRDSPDLNLLSDIPELAKLALAIEGALEPVLVTDIRRTVRLLHLSGKAVVEMSIDEGCIRSGAANEPVSEVELELKSGSIAPLYQLAIKLQASTSMWISPESKSVRGLHLHSGRIAGAQKADAPGPEPNHTAATGLHTIIGGTLGHLIANIGPTLRGDAEGLHQMRIALRGTRAALRLFERDLNGSARRFDAGLLRFARTFGAARDWDVLCLQTLPAAAADLAAVRAGTLDAVAGIHRQAAHSAVRSLILSRDFTALILRLAAWAARGAAQPRTIGNDRMGMKLEAVAPALLSRVAGIAKKRGRHAARLSPEKLHNLRKSLKRLSSDAGYLAKSYRRRAVNLYLGRCKKLLKILGVANDAKVTQRLVGRLVSGDRRDLAKPADVLARWSERRGRKSLRGLKRALRKFRATPVFWRPTIWRSDKTTGIPVGRDGPGGDIAKK